MTKGIEVLNRVTDRDEIVDQGGKLTIVEYHVFNKMKALGAGKATLTADLRGVVRGIPAPGAEVEIISSTKLAAEILYRSRFGDKRFTVHPDFLLKK